MLRGPLKLKEKSSKIGASLNTEENLKIYLLKLGRNLKGIGNRYTLIYASKKKRGDR